MENEFAEEITPEDSVVPIFLVELTPEQIAERKEVAAAETARFEAAAQAEIERQAAVESATAKLAKIGLTIDEIQAVIGMK